MKIGVPMHADVMALHGSLILYINLTLLDRKYVTGLEYQHQLGEDGTMLNALGTRECCHIYIGLRDRERMQQLCTTEDFVGIISGICADYRIAFSMAEQVGGYMMADGTFITENSLVLTICGFTREQVLALAETLRKRLNQESVLVSVEAPELFLLADRPLSV